MRLITKEETKARLEQYAGLRLELHNRLQQLARLQQADRDRPLMTGSRAEEYARRIALIVQHNRQELEAIERAVDTLPNPMEREVLRLRYLESEENPKSRFVGVRISTWSEVAFAIQGSSCDAAIYRTTRLHDKAISHLAASWKDQGEQ